MFFICIYLYGVHTPYAMVYAHHCIPLHTIAPLQNADHCIGGVWSYIYANFTLRL